MCRRWERFVCRGTGRGLFVGRQGEVWGQGEVCLSGDRERCVCRGTRRGVCVGGQGEVRAGGQGEVCVCRGQGEVCV